MGVPFFFLTISPALAAQPEIIWLEDYSEDARVTNFDPEHYGDGLYAVKVEEGERIYTALSAKVYHNKRFSQGN